MHEVRSLRPIHYAIVTLIVSSVIAGCAGAGAGASSATSGGSASTPASPAFTSTPVTQAAEGTAYSYQVAVSSGATLSLTTSPAGAALSGNTVSWTPTPAQARTANNFTVTAAVTGASPTTQSWTVTPAGAVRITRVDTQWNDTGSVDVPFDWSTISGSVAALVPQPDGTFQTLTGTAGPNGTFTIQNVPAGYYWLELGPQENYWTSSSTFDAGSDTLDISSHASAGAPTTSFRFNFTSPYIAPLGTPNRAYSVEFYGYPFAQLMSSWNGFTGSVQSFSASNLNFSSVPHVFVMDYVPITIASGSVLMYALGPELTLSNLPVTTGATNTVGGVLDPAVPASSMNLSIQGRSWFPLLLNAVPGGPSSVFGSFGLAVQPYVTGNAPNIVSQSLNIDLFVYPFGPVLQNAQCTMPSPQLAFDLQGEAVPYSDPFPAAWRRVFYVCEAATVSVTVPGNTQPQTLSLLNTQTTLPPTGTVKPLLSTVQNPKINGADMFTATTLNSTAVTLSWDAPAVGTPVGYVVTILTPTTIPARTVGGTTIPASVLYSTSTVLETATTTIKLPPNAVTTGKTYLIKITALADARTNVETSPHRSALPTASADVLSAAITVN